MARKKVTIDLNGGDNVTADSALVFQFYDADDSDSIITTANHAAVGSKDVPGTDGTNITYDLTTIPGSMILDGVDVGTATNLKVSVKDEANNESALSAAFSESAVLNWDISAYSYSGISKDVTAFEPVGETVGLYSLDLNSDKSKMWILYRGNKTIVEHSLSPVGDITTITTPVSDFVFPGLATAFCISMRDDDSCLYFADYGNNKLFALPLATPSLLSSNIYNVNNFWTIPETQASAVLVRSGYVYYACNSDRTIRRRAISNMDDMTTVAGSQTDSLDCSTQITDTIVYIKISDDGLHLYAFESTAGNTEFWEYTLLSDGTLAGGTYSGNTLTISEDAEHRGFFFDGSQIISGGRGTGTFNKLYNYTV